MKVVNIDSYKDIPGVTYVKLSEANEALVEARKSSHPVVFVTTQHDYGLAYQKEHSIANDLKKDFCLNFEPYAKEMGEGNGLEPIYFTPRANVEFCKTSDEYSVKIDTWTHCTYSELELDIPDNVTWFMPNCNVDHLRIHHLPFGVNTDPEGIFEFTLPPEGSAHITERPDQQNRLYVNFSEHTFERKMMNVRFAGYDWATVITKPDANGPNIYDHMSYLNQLASHKYVLCPSGVGFDSFRVWEALFVGSISVMKRDYWNEWMQDVFPVILVDDFYDITDVAYLESRTPKTDEVLLYDPKTKEETDWNDYLISEEFWRGKIEDVVRQ
jgi:hypothetical protein